MNHFFCDLVVSDGSFCLKLHIAAGSFSELFRALTSGSGSWGIEVGERQMATASSCGLVFRGQIKYSKEVGCLNISNLLVNTMNRTITRFPFLS